MASAGNTQFVTNKVGPQNTTQYYDTALNVSMGTRDNDFVITTNQSGQAIDVVQIQPDNNFYVLTDLYASNVHVVNHLFDSASSSGSNGYVLSSTSSGVEWVSPLSGGGGNEWINTYLVSEPPPVIFGQKQSDTASIYIYWDPISQIQVGFTSEKLPFISQQSFEVDNNGSISFPFSNNIVGIVLSSIGISGEQNIMFPDGISRYVYKYVDSQYINNQPSELIVTNENYNGSSSNVIVLPSFQTSGSPSAPRTLILTPSIFNILLGYQSPEYIDASNQNNQIGNIQSYKVTYETSGSTIRYGGPIPQSLITEEYNSSLSHTIYSLSPDCDYTIHVSAKNNINISYGQDVYDTVKTLSLNPPPSLSSISFPSRYVGLAYKLDGTAVSTLTVDSSAWTSDIFEFNVNEKNSRGKLGVGILTTLTTSFNSTPGPTVEFNGYPITNSSSNTFNFNNITLTTSASTDAYTQQEQQGFYLNGHASVTIRRLKFVSSPNENIFNVTQLNHGTVTHTFYYDNVQDSPTVSIQAFGFTSQSVTISGKDIYHGTPEFYVESTIENMGEYFYSENPFAYTLTVDTITTTITRTNMSSVVSGITGNLMDYSLGVYDTIQSESLDSLYFKGSISIDMTARNVLNSATGSTTLPVEVTIDGPSYNLIYNIHAQSLQSTVPGTFNIGFRRYIDGYDVSNYDNTLDMSTLPLELTCQNGALYNIGNVSETRYSAFGWKVGNSTSYGSLIFKIYGLRGGSVSISNGVAYIGGSKIELKYRLEDSNNKLPDGTSTYLSSVWCDATKTSDPVLSTNYSSGSEKGGLLTGASYDGTVLTVPVNFPCRPFTVNSNTPKIILYARVGIPSVSGPCGFTYISANIF